MTVTEKNAPKGDEARILAARLLADRITRDNDQAALLLCGWLYGDPR